MPSAGNSNAPSQRCRLSEEHEPYQQRLSLRAATYSGSAQFIGVFNSPDANVTMSGGMNFHYDEALGGRGGVTYIAASWREL
jgi:hypothetical protein